jgi:hypothetical protein
MGDKRASATAAGAAAAPAATEITQQQLQQSSSNRNGTATVAAAALARSNVALPSPPRTQVSCTHQPNQSMLTDSSTSGRLCGALAGAGFLRRQMANTRDDTPLAVCTKSPPAKSKTPS